MIRLRSAWLAAAFLLATAYGIVHAAPAHAEMPKFAVVDLQRALTEIEEGRQAKGQLKSLFDQR